MKVYPQLLLTLQCIGDARAIVTTCKPLPLKLARVLTAVTRKQTRSLTLHLDQDTSLNLSFFFCNESNHSIDLSEMSMSVEIRTLNAKYIIKTLNNAVIR